MVVVFKIRGILEKSKDRLLRRWLLYYTFFLCMGVLQILTF